MAEIEKALHKLHAAAREARSATGPEVSVGTDPQAAHQPVKGFAKVSSVAEGSPAAMAVSMSQRVGG